MAKHLSCPKCGYRHRNAVQKVETGLYYCSRCHMMFDDDPDEGGDFCNDPSKRLERAESRRTR